jgi:hypothetical protein
MNPELFGISIPSALSTQNRRLLILVSKILQKCAFLCEFDEQKEPYMRKLNRFVPGYHNIVSLFISDVCRVILPQDATESQPILRRRRSSVQAYRQTFCSFLFFNFFGSCTKPKEEPIKSIGSFDVFKDPSGKGLVPEDFEDPNVIEDIYVDLAMHLAAICRHFYRSGEKMVLVSETDDEILTLYQFLEELRNVIDPPNNMSYKQIRDRTLNANGDNSDCNSSTALSETDRDRAIDSLKDSFDSLPSSHSLVSETKAELAVVLTEDIIVRSDQQIEDVAVPAKIIAPSAISPVAPQFLTPYSAGKSKLSYEITLSDEGSINSKTSLERSMGVIEEEKSVDIRNAHNISVSEHNISAFEEMQVSSRNISLRRRTSSLPEIRLPESLSISEETGSSISDIFFEKVEISEEPSAVYVEKSSENALVSSSHSMDSTDNVDYSRRQSMRKQSIRKPSLNVQYLTPEKRLSVAESITSSQNTPRSESGRSFEILNDPSFDYMATLRKSIMERKKSLAAQSEAKTGSMDSADEIFLRSASPIEQSSRKASTSFHKDETDDEDDATSGYFNFVRNSFSRKSSSFGRSQESVSRHSSFDNQEMMQQPKNASEENDILEQSSFQTLRNLRKAFHERRTSGAQSIDPQKKKSIAIGSIREETESIVISKDKPKPARRESDAEPVVIVKAKSNAIASPDINQSAENPYQNPRQFRKRFSIVK